MNTYGTDAVKNSFNQSIASISGGSQSRTNTPSLALASDRTSTRNVSMPVAHGVVMARLDAQQDATPQQALAASDMQEYLIAHQTHSAGAYLNGGSQQVRAVSLVSYGAGQ